MATLDLSAAEQAATDKDGRRLAARIFAELGLSEGALMIPRREAELAVCIAAQAGSDVQYAHHAGFRHCRVCGCTSLTACRGPDGPCSWAEPDLCTVCAAYPEPV
jgi:hypothetical protein